MYPSREEEARGTKWGKSLKGAEEKTTGEL